MIKVSIIGTGFGSAQAKVFQKLDGVEVIGICGRDFEKTQRIAVELNIPKVYKDYKELLADDESTLVSIATPNYLHKPIFLDAIKTGKDIILEKPAGINSAEIEEMIKAAKSYKGLIVVDHPLRFNPVVRKIQQLIDDGTLGKVSFMQFSQYTNYVSDKNKKWEWFDDPVKGGGQILNMGTHLMDLARFMNGMSKLRNGNLIQKTVLDKYLDTDEPDKQVEIEHQIAANIDWANGVNTNFFNTTTSFGYKNFEIKIMGSKGVFFYDDMNGAQLSTSNEQELTKVNISDPLEHIEAGRSFVSKSFKFFAKELVDYLNGKTKNSDYCTLEQALENMRYLEKLSK